MHPPVPLRRTRDQGTLKTPKTRDAGGSMANLGEKKGKGKRQDISSQQIISEGLCEVCKVLRLDEGLSNYLQLHKGQGKGDNIQ